MRHDLCASVVVFLVALPLAMGIALASGYPPVAGLVTGVVGGIIVGALSGAPLQVSGAAAGLAVLCYQGVQTFGLAGMAVVVALAGALQLAAGLARLGRWFQAVSPTVLYGMLAGIGVLIVAGQLHVMADGAPRGTGLQNLAAVPAALQAALASPAPLGVGLLTIAALVGWPSLARGPLRFVPGPLVAVALATVLAALVPLEVKRVTIPESLFGDLSLAAFDLSALSLPILGAALQLALVASAESLLCASAVDRMHHGPRANLDRELAAQGIGNILCGVAGALPMTGVIVRSSANVHAGARTRASAMLHGVWLLLLVGLAPGLLRHVPVAALAGLLVYTGVKLVDVRIMRRLYAQGRSELAIYATTLAVIVAYDLLAGVLLGLALSGLKLLLRLTHLSVTVEAEPDAARHVLDLRGAATFLRLPRLLDALERLPRGGQVVVRARELHLIDHACAEHLESWRSRFEGRGGRVEVDGAELFKRRSS